MGCWGHQAGTGALLPDLSCLGCEALFLPRALLQKGGPQPLATSAYRVAAPGVRPSLHPPYGG